MVDYGFEVFQVPFIGMVPGKDQRFGFFATGLECLFGFLVQIGDNLVNEVEVFGGGFPLCLGAGGRRNWGVGF